MFTKPVRDPERARSYYSLIEFYSPFKNITRDTISDTLTPHLIHRQELSGRGHADNPFTYARQGHYFSNLSHKPLCPHQLSADRQAGQGLAHRGTQVQSRPSHHPPAPQ